MKWYLTFVSWNRPVPSWKHPVPIDAAGSGIAVVAHAGGWRWR